MAQTPEELEREKQQLEEQVDDAAAKAKQEAEAKGATPEEVTTAVEKARKEEKDKLYPQIEALKESMKEIQDVLRAEREEKEKIKREAEEKAEAQRLAKLSDTEKQLEAIKRIEEQLKEEREERKRLETQWREARTAQELDAYRETLLKAAGDEIIPELVRGNTKEEIDAALTIAKARYKEFAEKIKQTVGAQVKGNMPSANPDTAAFEEQELEEQLDFDPIKYRNDPDYREKIKGQLERVYAKQSGR